VLLIQSNSYIGWGPDWDEVINDLSRIEPEGKHVKLCKAWVKFGPKFTHWPCTLYLRRFKAGSEIAIPYLEDESRVLVRPFGPSNPKYSKYFAGDTWVKATNVWPIHFNKEMKWTAAGLSDPKCADEFRAALKEMDNSACEELQFKFVGTHDITFTYRKRPNGTDGRGAPLTDEERKARRSDYAISSGDDLLSMIDSRSLSAFMPMEQPAIDIARPHIVNSGYTSSEILTAVNDSLIDFFKTSSAQSLPSCGDTCEEADAATTSSSSSLHALPVTSSFLLEQIFFKLAPIIDSHQPKKIGESKHIKNCRKFKSKKIDVKRKKR
jgi:hypothetical protein